MGGQTCQVGSVGRVFFFFFFFNLFHFISGLSGSKNDPKNIKISRKKNFGENIWLIFKIFSLNF